MTTYKLTRNDPDPITGLPKAALGWHFTAPTIGDVYEGALFVQFRANWGWQIFPNPDIPTQQRMSLTKTVAGANQPLQVVVDNTQWFTLDGDLVRVLDDADVTANYTVEAYVAPPPPGPGSAPADPIIPPGTL